MNTAKAKEDFLKAFVNSLGDVSATCRRINVARNTYYKWLENDSRFKAKVENSHQEIKDWGESQLKLIMQGIPIRDKETNKITGYDFPPNANAIIFFNKTQNKDRGYVERLETEDVTGINIVVREEKDGKIVDRIAKTLKN